MHELAIVKQVIRTSVNYMEKNNAEKVEEIYLHIGALNMVVEPLLSKAFDFAKRGTPCEGAELYMSFFPVTLRCEDCGERFQVQVKDIYTTPCPNCHQKHIKYVSGNEFFVDCIKVS